MCLSCSAQRLSAVQQRRRHKPRGSNLSVCTDSGSRTPPFHYLFPKREELQALTAPPLVLKLGSSSVSGSPVPSTSGTSTPRRGRRQLPQTPSTPRPHVTYSPAVRKPTYNSPGQGRLRSPSPRHFSPPGHEPTYHRPASRHTSPHPGSPRHASPRSPRHSSPRSPHHGRWGPPPDSLEGDSSFYERDY
ncbi:hypothetical protein DNTS_017200, partial [Danionella cerebrum]